MKSTGIVRKIDELGRLVLPIELRRSLEIADGDYMEIFTENQCIVLRKYSPACMVCHEVTDLIQLGDRKICPKCLREAYEKL